MKLLATLFLFVLFGCDSTDVKTDKVEYAIKQGDHSSTPVEVAPVTGITKFAVKAVITQGARYEFRNPDGTVDSNQWDWNKLTGFSDCRTLDAFKGKGAMIVWRWSIEQEAVELGAYVHNASDGSFHFQVFDQTLAVDEVGGFTSGVHDFSIEIREAAYVFGFDTEEIIMEGEQGRGCNEPSITGRLLNPWFGGTYPAPHEVKLEIQYQSE